MATNENETAPVRRRKQYVVCVVPYGSSRPASTHRFNSRRAADHFAIWLQRSAYDGDAGADVEVIQDDAA